MHNCVRNLGRRWPDGESRHRPRNVTAYGDPQFRKERAPPGERSYYLHWIRKDLEPWASKGGITRVSTMTNCILHQFLIAVPLF